MTKVPFHRRAFLWVFILAFVLLAPAAVFYTAGYRWNAKKGIIERNGTLILDTTPTGATVTLNGERISDRTPVTLQNVAPGTYRIRLELDGSLSWEKTLDVRPERVTFVNDVRLWPDESPELVQEGDLRAVRVAPDAQMMAFVRNNGKITQLIFRSTDGSLVIPPNERSATFEDAAPTGTVRLLWNPSSSAVLVWDETGTQWVASRTGTGGAVLLPEGRYRWDGSTLLGILPEAAGRPAERFEYVVGNGTVRRTALASGVIDENDLYRIVSGTGTSRLFLEERSNASRRYELPEGRWTLEEQVANQLFLTNGSVWLGFDPSTDSIAPVTLPADEPPTVIRRGRESLLLAYGGGELWFDPLGEDPQLLVRSSSQLTGMGWYRDGTQAFYATQQQVVAIGLDPRDGRLQTTLAAFDHIFSMSVGRTSLFVAGLRDGKTGLWEVRVE